MKPWGKPWSQLTLEEKVDSLHIAQQRIVRSVNHLARLIEPGLTDGRRNKQGRREKDHTRQLW